MSAPTAVNKIGGVLARAGLTAYKMASGHASPLSDPVAQAGYLVQARDDDPNGVYVEWIDHWFTHGAGWRHRCDLVARALLDAGYTVEAPGQCGPVGEYVTHDYMRVTYQPPEGV